MALSNFTLLQSTQNVWIRNNNPNKEIQPIELFCYIFIKHKTIKANQFYIILYIWFYVIAI